MLYLKLNPDAGGAEIIDLPGEVQSYTDQARIQLTDGPYTRNGRVYTPRDATFALPANRPYSDTVPAGGGAVPRRQFRLLLSNDFPVQALGEGGLQNAILVAAPKYGEAALAAAKDTEFQVVAEA